MIENNEPLYLSLFQEWFDDLEEAKCLELLDSILPSLDVLYENTTVFPLIKNVFRVFNSNPKDIKVILLGQDPYHSVHPEIYRDSTGKLSKGVPVPDACGYSFLTENGYAPPSLINMFIELTKDTSASRIPGYQNYNGKPEQYPFNKWVEQGVMMLNTALTVEKNKPGSHLLIWREFSSRLIKHLVNKYPNLVWILLGNKAQDLLKPYDCKKVEAYHPSPLAGGKFFGSNIYSKTNELLTNPIKW